MLDVGFGLAYGITFLSVKSGRISGIDIDQNCVIYCQNNLLGRNPKLTEIELYDGKEIPFDTESFDIITCIDVLEHVPDFENFLSELMKVCRKGVFISTSNRRPEYTNKDGTPKIFGIGGNGTLKNYEILMKYGFLDWNFLNGSWDGPFTVTNTPQQDTLALAPFLNKPKK